MSPLKALAADIRENLDRPLAEIREAAQSLGLTVPAAARGRPDGRHAGARARGMLRQPPHLLITTPESLYLLLTAAPEPRVPPPACGR